MPSNTEYSAIADPTPDLEGLHQAVLSLKETVEVLIGQRGSGNYAVVTQADLVAQKNLANCIPGVVFDNLGMTTQTGFVSGIVEAPTNKDFRIVEKVPFAYTLTELACKLSAGTLTATLKINATGVTGGALSVTSAQGSGTLTANNVCVAGDVVLITVSAVAAPADLSYTLKFTRAPNV